VNPWKALLSVAVLAAAPALRAETLYVIEQLVVNVNSAPDATGGRVGTLKSGDAVEVLERQGDQIHVHLANGTEGWVRKSYLSEQEPLQHRLNERNAEVEKLQQDVARLEGEVAAAKAALQATPAAAPTSTGRAAAPALPAPAADPARPGDEPTAPEAAHEPPYFMTPPDSPARPLWHWALGSFVLALGLGFVLGWHMLDRRIRRKYGGMRIY